jgi:hypothetical protein
VKGTAFNHTNTTRCYIGSNHDRALAGFEFVQDPVTFVLLLVAVNSYTDMLAQERSQRGVENLQRAGQPS